MIPIIRYWQLYAALSGFAFGLNLASGTRERQLSAAQSAADAEPVTEESMDRLRKRIIELETENQVLKSAQATAIKPSRRKRSAGAPIASAPPSPVAEG